MSYRCTRLFAVAAVAALVAGTGAARVAATASNATSVAPAGGPAFDVGAAVGDFTPPPFGAKPDGKVDPADCIAGTPLETVFSGPRPFAFEEPYIDRQGTGHYDLGDPYVDCDHNGRWDGNYIGGGTNNPRYYTHVADPVTARAVAVTAGGHTVVIEVVDQEGLFNVYQQRIRDRAAALVASGGLAASDIFISATHDESAPDSLGLGGPSQASSGVNDYWVDYMIEVSARAIADAFSARLPAHLRFAEAVEPANLRQCWSSYPFVDDQLMPTVQAVSAGTGKVIATLASVSQHAETLGFNPDTPDHQAAWITSDWPNFFRTDLETRYPGSVAIEMAGSVGSNETPQVFGQALSRTPQQQIDASHPAGCRTLFAAPPGDPTPMTLGYKAETRTLGTQLADQVAAALATSASWSQSADVWGQRTPVCLPLANGLFLAAAGAGVFAQRPGYAANCALEVPAAPNGSTAGNEVLTEVAAFRIGDGEFASVPGEVFPFTYLGSFLGPEDMPYSQYGMSPMLMPHMHARYRFIDGLAEDMVGYIFPQGNAVGIPGEHADQNNLGTSDTDRFGCGHSDDSESTGSTAGDLLGNALVGLLDGNGGRPAAAEVVALGRYVMPDGTLLRDPLGQPGSLKCNVDKTFTPSGPAVGVWIAPTGPGQGLVVRPAAWMSLSGQTQAAPDRNTRGWVDATSVRHWLDVFPDVAFAPTRVTPP